MKQAQSVWALVVLALVASGCVGPPESRSSDGQRAERSPAAFKRITAAVQSDPPVLTRRLTISNEPGLDNIEDLINPGLAEADDRGGLHPVLVEQVPTIENGLWKLFPDGRMQTTWKLRAGVAWHDGTPFTAEDVLFTHRVAQDPEVALARNIAYRAVESIDAGDDNTVVIRWKQPYIEADTAFNDDHFPRHVLEPAYREDKAGFVQLPYWSGPILGVGPYRVREWTRGSSLVLDAFNGYVLGSPRIDLIEVKFITDQNTLIANVLAGALDLTLGKTLTLEQATGIREQWSGGRVEATPANGIQVFPQLLSPNPPIIGLAQFRRALLHAIDRQEIADSLMFGLSAVVHSYVNPADSPEFQAAANRVVRYDYDPRQSRQLLEALGLSRASDGALHDSVGRRILVEIRTITTDINQKAMFSVADYWQRVGVAADPVVIPRQLAQEPEYRATFPGFEIVRNPADRDALKRHSSSQTPLPENSFRGNNRTRYMNPTFDALLDRYFTTIPIPERAQVFGEIVQHMTDIVLVMGLFYDMDTTVIGERLVNVGARKTGSTQVWNAHQWDVRS